jgi:hypothetical protein
MIFCEMKAICCGLSRKKRGGRRKNRVELVGFTKSTKKATTSRRRPNFPFDHNEHEALVIGESLDERESRD